MTMISILMVRMLAGVIERSGASWERFIFEAGIDPAWIDDGTRWLPIADYERVIDVALRLSGDAALGLHLGERIKPAMFDVLGLLCEQAPTLRDAVQGAIKYGRLLNEDLTVELQQEGVFVAIRIAGLSGSSALARTIAEFSMAGFQALIRMYVGTGAQPSEVRFSYPKPECSNEYNRVFGSSKRFGAAATELVFPRSWLERRQHYGNREMFAVLTTHAERTLDRLDRDTPIAMRVDRILEARGAQPISMQEVARELGMSERSLRRRMLGEGLSFVGLHARRRASAARRMLERPNTTIQETAYALGFSSAEAFHRAFKRWMGMTPMAYRRRF